MRSLAGLVVVSIVCATGGVAHAGLKTADIIKMVKAGLPASVVVSTIKASGAKFALKATDIINLHKAGVPAQIIEAMVATSKGKAASASSGASAAAEASRRREADRRASERRSAAERRREEERRREADRRREDDDRRAADRRRDDERRREEARRSGDERRREEARRLAEDRRRAEESRRRKFEEQERRERERKEAAAERRRREEEARRMADERREREREQRKRAEEQRLSEKVASFRTSQDLEDSGRFTEAAEGYYEFYTQLASPGTQEYNDAEFFLARSLNRAGVGQAAIPYLTNILLRGPKDANFRAAFRLFRRLSERLLYTAPQVMEKLSTMSIDRFSNDFRDEFNYTVGKFYNRWGNHTKALRFLNQVSERSPFFASAAYLQGLILLRQKKAKSAHGMFKKAVLAAEKSEAGSEQRGVLELGYMALARLAYEVGGHKAAIFYYNKIPHNSTKIGQALFEKGWTYFMSGNYQMALGTFHGLHGAYFAHRFHPDLYVLEATIYLNMCRFDYAKELVERYTKKYGKLHKQLKDILRAGTPPAELFRMFVATGEGRSQKLPKQIYNRVLQDAEFADLVAALKDYERQEKVVGSVPGREGRATKLWRRAAAAVRARKERLLRSAGSMIRRKLKKADQELGNFLIKADEITFETINAEKDQLDKETAALMKGKTVKKRTVAERGPSKVKFNWANLYWETSREVWADEVDSYRSTLQDRCAK